MKLKLNKIVIALHFIPLGIFLWNFEVWTKVMPKLRSLEQKDVPARDVPG